MKNDVTKMLITNATANAQYFLAIAMRSSLPTYCMKLVKIIGKVSKEMAIVGSITNVKNAIDAAGSPMPKNPLTIPANKRITITAMVMVMSCDGRIKLLMKSNKALPAYQLFATA